MSSPNVFLTAFSLLITPFIFIFGVFLGNVNGNVCYSQVISDLNFSSKIAALSSDKELRMNYVKKLDSIALYGYETQCEDLRTSVSDIYSLMEKK
jgi:hypothetical protein